mmetsp:Transcript_35889/g.92378  ORF Transcript_35889/g.92378 Transcript_35889/m.92378 type:complete len:388 (+) Transcript_35889:882-2045(+)
MQEDLDVAAAHPLATEDAARELSIRAAAHLHEGLARGAAIAAAEEVDGLGILADAVHNVVLAEEIEDVLLAGAEGQAAQAHRRRRTPLPVPVRRRRRRPGTAAWASAIHLQAGHLLRQRGQDRVHGQHAVEACHARSCRLRGRRRDGQGRGSGRGAAAGRQAGTVAADEGARVGCAEGQRGACALPGRLAEVDVRRLVRAALHVLAPHCRWRASVAAAPEVHGHSRGPRPVRWRRHRPRRPVVVPGDAAAEGAVRGTCRAVAEGEVGVHATLPGPVRSEGLRRAPVARGPDLLGRALVASCCGSPAHDRVRRHGLHLGAHRHELAPSRPRHAAAFHLTQVLVRDVADASGRWTSRALGASAVVLLLGVREAGGEVPVVLATFPFQCR